MFPEKDVMIEAERCHNCGACLSVCPVYKALGVETLASRGRIDTIRGLIQGDLSHSPRMAEILSTCLLCMACQAACPSGVSVQKIVMEGRHRLIEKKGLPPVKRFAFRKLLKDRKALRRALSMAAAVQRFSPEEGPGKLRHLPLILSGLAGKRALPTLARTPLSERIPEVTPPWPNAQKAGRVAIFGGCYMEFVDTTIVEEGIRVLASQGFEVVYPKSQICCGAPVLYSGDLEGAKGLAMENAGVFAGQEDIKAVVTLCATCNSALKEGYRTVAENLQGVERERVLALSCKIMDFSEFLLEHAPCEGFSRGLPFSVTYHDPCHHVRGVEIREEPRKILEKVRNVRLIEMSEPARCCGGGGSFSLTHPDLSVEIGTWKIKDIMGTGADAAVTSCPGCILQIQEMALRREAPVKVMHIAQVLNRALKEENQ